VVPRLQTGFRQRHDGDDDKDGAPLFIQNVLHRQRRDNGNPDLRRFKPQVTKGLPELRLDTQAPVQFSDGGKNLRPESAVASPRNKCPQLVANPLGVGDPVGGRAARGFSHRVWLPVPVPR
jgi:hypothetical protein